MSIKRTIFIIIMTLILCIMTLGYAALQERIDIEVEANIDSTYRVEITSVQEGAVVGDARSVSAPSYNNLTSTFNVGLTNDTDYITYTIEITNYSTVDIRLNNTEITSTNNNMSFVKGGIRNGDIILAGSTKTITIKIKLDTETGSEQTGTVTVMFDFTRLKGGLGEVEEDIYTLLPSDYTELEYLECITSQCIFQFDYSTLEYDLVTIKVSLTSGTSEAAFFGLDGKFELYFQNKKFFTWSGIESSQNDMNIEYNIPYDINAKITTNVNSKYKAMLFSYRSDKYPFLGKIYYCYIERNGERIFNFIPALDSNDVPCMYDTVSGETFYNQGTGDFLYQLKE